MVEVFGEKIGCTMFRKIAPWYARRFGPSSEFSKKVVLLNTRVEFDAILANYTQWRAQFCDEAGELLPRYRQPPMIASFMKDAPPSARRESIPVPKGPVEVW
jgi:galactokinase